MAEDTRTPKEIYDAEEKKKQAAQKLEEAKLLSQAPSAAYDGGPMELDDTSSDWDRLSTIAHIKFPEHLALKFNLTPMQRRAAIAFCIGWSKERIAELSGIAYSTVTKWFRKEELLEFIKAFNYHSGSADNREVIDSEVFTSLQVLKDLRDDSRVSATTRADIAKWFYETKYGKAKEQKEIKGVSIRDLTEQLQRLNTDELDDFTLKESPKVS